MTASTLPAAGTGRARALRAPLATAGAALAATTYVGLVDPNQSGPLPDLPVPRDHRLLLPGLRLAAGGARADPRRRRRGARASTS